MNSRSFGKKLPRHKFTSFVPGFGEILRLFAESKLRLHAFHAYFAFTSYNIKLLKEEVTKSHETFLSQCLCPGDFSSYKIP